MASRRQRRKQSRDRMGAAGIALMMAVAISMHFKVGDPPKKSLPAAIFMILSIIVIFI